VELLSCCDGLKGKYVCLMEKMKKRIKLSLRFFYGSARRRHGGA